MFTLTSSTLPLPLPFPVQSFLCLLSSAPLCFLKTPQILNSWPSILFPPGSGIFPCFFLSSEPHLWVPGLAERTLLSPNCQIAQLRAAPSLMSQSRWETEIGTVKEGREVIKRGIYQFNTSRVAASQMEKHLSAQTKKTKKQQKTKFPCFTVISAPW